MQQRPIRHRRARRADADAVRAVLGATGGGSPPADRGALRRYRHIVADLGGDLYLATCDERVVGLVHVTYARHLLDGQRGTLALLAVLPDERRRGVGAGLLRLATERARRRGCRVLSWTGDRNAAEWREWLGRQGWQDGGTKMSVDLSAAAE